jgi:hypothetical protein
MKTLVFASILVAALAALPVAAQVSAPDLDIGVAALLPPVGMIFDFTVAGPPNTPFAVLYALGNVFYDPNPVIGLLYTGQTGESGVSAVQVPFQTPVQINLTEAQLAAVFLPPAAPPIPTELVALTLTAGPPPSPPPCGPAIGAMAYHSDACMIIASVKVCPGDLFEIKKNGVVIASGVGPASGEIVIALGNQCLGAGDTLTGVLNGNDADPFLGPIRG